MIKDSSDITIIDVTQENEIKEPQSQEETQSETTDVLDTLPQAAFGFREVDEMLKDAYQITL
jgi:hypothetical protein